jgi:hypothetical protein
VVGGVQTPTTACYFFGNTRQGGNGTDNKRKITIELLIKKDEAPASSFFIV